MGVQGQPADFGDLGKEEEEKGWFERAQQTIGVSSVSFSGHAEAFLDQLTLQVSCPVGKGLGEGKKPCVISPAEIRVLRRGTLPKGFPPCQLRCRLDQMMVSLGLFGC